MKMICINSEDSSTKLRQISMHDSVFSGFSYNSVNRTLIITTNLPFENNREVTVEFEDIKGMHMTQCDYWGPSPYIFSFFLETADNNVLLPELFKEKKDYDVRSLLGCCSLQDNNDYMEAVIQFTSGDYLRIVCETIKIVEME